MADTLPTAENDPPNMAPLLPDEDLADDYDDEDDLEVEPAVIENEEPPAKPKKRTKRRRQSREQVEQAKQTREMELEEWLVEMDNKFGWDRPGVTCELHRLYPRSVNGIPSSGLVEEKRGACYTRAEVLDRFGGGVFEMKIVAPADVFGRPPRMSKKRFEVSGVPKISDQQLDANRQQQSTVGISQSEEKLFMMAYKDQQKQLDALRNRDHSIDYKPYEQSVETIRLASSAAAEAKIDAAEKLAAEKAAQAQEARQELARLTAEMRRFEDESRQKIREASETSNSLLGALLPTFSDNATRQVEGITRQFEAREARIEEMHAKELQAQATFFQTQIEQLRMSFEAQINRAETTWLSQKGLLEQQLQYFQLQNADLTQQVGRLQTELMNSRVQQLESLRKDHDPMTKITELAQIRDVFSDLGLGGGSGGGEGDLGEDAGPMLKLLNNAVNSFGPVVQAALQRGQPGAMPPGMVPAGAMPPGAIVERAMVPAGQAQAAAPQAPPPAPKVKVKISELHALVRFISQARRAGTTPEQVCAVALQHPEVERGTLKVLVQKPPEKVLAELSNAGVLDEYTEEDREYIGELLGALKKVV